MISDENNESHTHDETHDDEEEKHSFSHEQILNYLMKNTWTASNGVACTISPPILNDILMKPILSIKSAKDTVPMTDK